LHEDRKDLCPGVSAVAVGAGSAAVAYRALLPSSVRVECHVTTTDGQVSGSCQATGSSATRTFGSEISLHRSRMTAIPSAPQRSGSEAFMLHVRGHRLGHFRKGLGADHCSAATPEGSEDREADIRPNGVESARWHGADAWCGRAGWRPHHVQYPASCDPSVSSAVEQGTADRPETPAAAKAGLGHSRSARARRQPARPGIVQPRHRQQAPRM
jgi:hypothetical protein